MTEALRKRGPGRPPFVPTRSSRTTVKALLTLGWRQSQVADVLGITLPTLRKHFRAEIDASAQDQARIASALVQVLGEKGASPAGQTEH